MAKKNLKIKKLRVILKKHSGRNNQGKITIRHRGGRQKRFYRVVDFKRDKREMEAKVVNIEYDPNRTANIALIEYSDGEKRYILSPEGLKVGDKIIASETAEIKVGNALPLKNIPLGVNVHNIELYPGRGGQIVKSAGLTATIIGNDSQYVYLKLPSGEKRKVLRDCYATIGQVSNVTHQFEKIGKAGRKRLMGIKPTVRGTAQNPRSHPHGGGEGRSGEGMHPKTPWGKLARGKKTRKKKLWSDKFILQRRK